MSRENRLSFAASLSLGLLFLGILILLCLVLYHIGHSTLSLSHTEKYIFAGLIGLAVILLVLGQFFSTSTGTRFLSRIFQIPVDDIKQVRAQKKYRVLSLAVFLAFFVTIYFTYLDEKQAVFNLDATRYHSDTHEYLRVSSYPLTDIRFLAGIRSFGLPLFYKVVGYNGSNFIYQGNMNHVSRVQWEISVVSWTLLAVVTCFAMKNWISRIFIFSSILMLGASVDISFWDHPLLTESLAISLFILLLSLLILAGLFMESVRKASPWIQALLVAVILLVAILYTFIRDTNAYFLLFLAGFMVLGVFIRAVRKAPLFPAYLSIAIGFILLFWFGNTSVNLGKRYVPPLLHVFGYRFIPQEQSRTFFIDHGMPFDARIATIDRLTLHELNSNFVTDPSILRLIAWLGEDGERLNIQYLLSHPGYFFFSPLNDIQHIVNGRYAEYRLNLTPTPVRLRLLSAIAYLRFKWLPILFLILALVCIGLIFERSNRGRIIWYILLALFLTAYPLSLIAWHGDTNDIERHSVQVAVQLRLAVWILLGLCIERGYPLVKKFRARARMKESI
jgi:hypothetical protein